MYTKIINLIVENPLVPLTVACVMLLLYIIYLHHKITVLTGGASGASLEEVIQKCVESVKDIEKKNELISKHALSLDTRVSFALRNAQTIRYKAFETGGSSQSFSIALLNEKGFGVVITSLHARDRINTFAKPIEKYTSTYDLTDEEKSVINDAKTAHKKALLAQS